MKQAARPSSSGSSPAGAATPAGAPARARSAPPDGAGAEARVDAVAMRPLPRGRPRDPLLESRVFDAAIELYAECGWSGFNFEAIARRAGVGKAALYRRWESRGELLRQTLEARWLQVGAIDTGSLRGDLVRLAHMCLEVRTSSYAGTALHMLMDGQRFPEVAAVTAPYGEATIRQARAIVRRAIARGELEGSVNPGMVLDVVVGGVTNHVATTPARLRPAMLAKMEAFAESLVDILLRGISQSGAQAASHVATDNGAGVANGRALARAAPSGVRESMSTHSNFMSTHPNFNAEPEEPSTP